MKELSINFFNNQLKNIDVILANLKLFKSAKIINLNFNNNKLTKTFNI